MKIDETAHTTDDCKKVGCKSVKDFKCENIMKKGKEHVLIAPCNLSNSSKPLEEVDKTFPMKVRFGEQPHTKWYNSENNINLVMTDWPQEDFRYRCVEMVKATWADEPINAYDMDEEEIRKEFIKILKFKVLPNSLESLRFQFLLQGLTLIEVTHLLRHRTLSSIHAQCSADRFLQNDSCFIPSSIEGTQFEERYKKLTHDAKQLYCDMVDSKKVSILDARYILTRNHRYFYHFGCDLKTAIQFINQRKCTAIQPELDNIIAKQMLDSIAEIIPEIKEVVHEKCGPECVFVKSDPIDSSRVYYPDNHHFNAIRTKYGNGTPRLDEDYYLMHGKTRKDMGIDI